MSLNSSPDLTPSRENQSSQEFPVYSSFGSRDTFSWRALRLLTLYRITFTVALTFLTQFNSDNPFLGSFLPQLFLQTTLLYMLFALVFFLVSFYRLLFKLQLQSQVLLDIIFLTILMHTSGGITSGIGMLIAISTISASIMISTPTSLGYSVVACLAILAEESYSSYFIPDSTQNFTQVGFLSVTFLGTGLMGYYLSRKIRESEIKAEASIRGLENMELLNEKIIEHMSTGVMVIDGLQNIRLLNRSAWAHLGMPESYQSRRLDQVSTPLSRQLNLWRRKKHYRAKAFRNTATGPSLIPSFSKIGETKENSIIFLDDASTLNQRAQNLKLASLGRLTASIAHEIRNPLGALSHAAQLVREGENLDSGSIELIDIIEKNASRVNEIIENIMQLSIRKSGQIKEINLSKYLIKLKENYLIAKDSDTKIDLRIESDDLIVHFDDSQLSQIINNLLDNGLRHSLLNSGRSFVYITVGVEPNDRTPFLDVIDIGEGISPEKAEKIFEPFFTTSKSGTGLGLYLSRELCEANKARLDYLPLTSGGSCFRISFSVNPISNP